MWKVQLVAKATGLSNAGSRVVIKVEGRNDLIKRQRQSSNEGHQIEVEAAYVLYQQKLGLEGKCLARRNTVKFAVRPLARSLSHKYLRETIDVTP